LRLLLHVVEIDAMNDRYRRALIVGVWDCFEVY